MGPFDRYETVQCSVVFLLQAQPQVNAPRYALCELSAALEQMLHNQKRQQDAGLSTVSQNLVTRLSLGDHM